MAGDARQRGVDTRAVTVAWGRRVVVATVVALATLVASALVAAAPASAATLTLELSRPAVVFGGAVTVSGVVEPALEGQEVVVSLGGVDVGAALTDATGAFALEFAPGNSGEVAARLTADGSASAPLPLVVRPAVTVTHGKLIPFLRARFVVKVAPATYDGEVTARVFHHGRRVATVRGRVRDGRAVLLVPLRGIDWFKVRFKLPATAALGSRAVEKSVELEWRRLAVGSTGLRVKGVLSHLKRLRIRTPGTGTTYTRAVADAVVCFQKTYRLSRDYVMNESDWRKLDRATLIRPRYATPARHIEIDEARQILMLVTDGAVIGIVPVSTGATGNTPEGAFTILRKTYVSSTFDGSLPLPRFMTFYGQMGIHGYPVVPPYPASHGCVREPLWVCDWVYDRAFVGERLYLYY
jgi:lipoprotein-anchoring transpeptidase ErfK/SrfK